ncbi:hypothetical protein GCM10010518_19660 [Kitasatospora cinereorecta]
MVDPLAPRIGNWVLKEAEFVRARAVPEVAARMSPSGRNTLFIPCAWFSGPPHAVIDGIAGEAVPTCLASALAPLPGWRARSMRGAVRVHFQPRTPRPGKAAVRTPAKPSHGLHDATGSHYGSKCTVGIGNYPNAR